MWDVKVAIFCCFLLHCGAKAATLLNELDDLASVCPTATERNFEEILPNACDAEQRADCLGGTPPDFRATFCHY